MFCSVHVLLTHAWFSYLCTWTTGMCTTEPWQITVHWFIVHVNCCEFSWPRSHPLTKGGWWVLVENKWPGSITKSLVLNVTIRDDILFLLGRNPVSLAVQTCYELVEVLLSIFYKIININIVSSLSVLVHSATLCSLTTKQKAFCTHNVQKQFPFSFPQKLWRRLNMHKQGSNLLKMLCPCNSSMKEKLSYVGWNCI